MAEVHTAFALRLRTPWEALDSGILFFRRSPALLFRYSLPFLLLTLSVPFLLPQQSLWYSFFLPWYLLPLQERLLLLPLSRRFFHADSRFSLLLRHLPHFLLRDLAWDLTLGRFSPWRSCLQPVRLLEDLRGRRKRFRLRDIRSRNIPAALALTASLLIAAAAVTLSSFLFVLLLAQILSPDLSAGLTGSSLRLFWLLYLPFAGSLTGAGALNSTCGFSLYLNSRVLKEGWDLEIALRSLEGRTERSSRSGTAASSLAAAVLALGLACLLPETAASSENPPPLPEEVPRESLDQVLASPDFGTEESRQGLRLRWKPNPEASPQLPQPGGPLLSFLKKAILLAAYLILAGTVLALLLYLLWKILPGFRQSLRRRFGKTAPPGRSSGIESIPSDSPAAGDPGEILAAAEAIYSRGRFREAWALVYRTVLLLWESKNPLSLGPEATEEEILQQVRKSTGLPAGTLLPLEGVVRTWQQLAYGGRIPGDRTFRQAVSVCRSRLPLSGGAP